MLLLSNFPLNFIEPCTLVCAFLIVTFIIGQNNPCRHYSKTFLEDIKMLIF